MGKPLYVALSQPKEKRRTELQCHFSQLCSLAQRKEERRTKLQCHWSQLRNQVRMAPATTTPASMYNPRHHPLFSSCFQVETTTYHVQRSSIGSLQCRINLMAFIIVIVLPCCSSDSSCCFIHKVVGFKFQYLS